VRVDARRKGEGKFAQRADLAGQLDPALGERYPEPVVPYVLGADDCDSEPAQLLLRRDLAAERVQRAPNERHPGREPLSELDRQTIEEQVRRARRRVSRGGARRQRDVEHGAAAARQPAGVGRREQRLQECLAREADIEALEAFRGIKQQDRRLVHAVRLQRDPAAHEADLGPLQLAERQRLRRPQEPRRRRWISGELLGLRGGERTAGELLRIDRELCCALEKSRGGGQAAACLRTLGRAFELRRDLLVGSGRSLRSMPCPPVGIELWIGDLGERTMHVESLPQ